MPTRLERLIALEDAICRGYYPNVQKLCDMFEIKARTLHEDIRALREFMGLEIEYDRSHNGYFNADPKKRLPQFNLTEGEVFALTLGKDILSQYTGTSFEPVLRGALEKIYERLPKQVQMDVEEIKAMVQCNRIPTVPFSRKVFMDFRKACAAQTVVEIEYYSAYSGNISRRNVNPQRLLENRGTWYLIAFCTLRQDLRLFALHRILNYQLLDDSFVPVDKGNLDEWVKDAFLVEHHGAPERVTIKFQPQAARYIRERNWHPSQQLEEHEDGCCTLSFETSSLDEVKRWVLMYGPQAIVLAPQALQSMVKADLRETLTAYGA